MSNYEKRIIILTSYLEESDETIRELQDKYDKEKNECKTLTKQIKDYTLKINVLNDTIDEIQKNSYDQKLDYTKEKSQLEILKKQIKDHTLKNNELNDTINKTEENLYNQKLKYDKKIGEYELENTTLRKSLKSEQDKAFKNHIYMTNIEKELKLSNDKVDSMSNQLVNYESIRIIDIEPINTMSLYDEINNTLKYKKYIEDLQLHINYLNNYYTKRLWFYRGISFIYLGIIIYCVTEILY